MADVLGERSKSRTGDSSAMPYASSASVTLLKASAARIVPARALPLSNYAVFGEWLSLVEHLVRDQGVGGSNPLSPTILSFTIKETYATFLASSFSSIL